MKEVGEKEFVSKSDERKFDMRQGSSEVQHLQARGHVVWPFLPSPVKKVCPKNRHMKMSRGIDKSQKFIKWNPPFKVGDANNFF